MQTIDEQLKDYVYIVAWRDGDWFEMAIFEEYEHAKKYKDENFGTDDDWSITRDIIRRGVKN